mgnify:CR=1 FL=1
MSEKLRFCTLFSGSSGNCTYIRYGDDEILIDAGKNAKCICKALEELGTSIENIKSIFITHEHSDHTSALRVLVKGRSIPIYAPEGCRRKMQELCMGELRFCEVPFEQRVGAITVKSFKTPHDSDDSVGYIADFGDYFVGVATDMGCVEKGVVRELAGCRYALIEANYDPEMLKCGVYPEYLKSRIASEEGHMSNTGAAMLGTILLRTGTQRVAFGHLSRENNAPECVKHEMDKKLAEKGIKGDYLVAGRDCVTVIADEFSDKGEVARC